MFKKQQFNWTPEIEEQVIEMVRNKVVYRKIAEKLGVTKDAVCGKIHRLRDQGRLPRLMNNPSYYIKTKPKVVASGGTVTGIKFEDLKRGQCQFELNGMKDLPTDFCGDRVKSGSAYCEKHHSVCYRGFGGDVKI
jgi:hypothetical protein